MRNRQLLCLPAEEGEGAALFLPHGVRHGVKKWGERPKEIIKYISFAPTHGYASSHLMLPRRRCWRKIIHTQIALLLCSSALAWSATHPSARGAARKAVLDPTLP